LGAGRTLGPAPESTQDPVWWPGSDSPSPDSPVFPAEADHSDSSVSAAAASPAGRGRGPGGRRRRGPRSALGWFNHFLASGLAVPMQILTLGLIGAAVFVNVTLPDLPDVEQSLRNVQYEQPMRVYSADGQLMAEFGLSAAGWCVTTRSRLF